MPDNFDNELKKKKKENWNSKNIKLQENADVLQCEQPP